MSRDRRLRCRFGSIVLVGVLLTIAAGSAAEADPARQEQPAGSCIEILRSVYRPPTSLPLPVLPPDVPLPIEFPGVGVRASEVTDKDPRFLTTYCLKEQAGEQIWALTSDAFPYFQSDACIEIFYDADAHDDDPAPETIEPLDQIDRYGRIESSGQPGPAGVTIYCRRGTGWTKAPASLEAPAGPYRDWADQCEAFRSPTARPVWTRRDPSTFSSHARMLGIYDDPEIDPYMVHQPESVIVYCRLMQQDPGPRTWYRMDLDRIPLPERISQERYKESTKDKRCRRVVSLNPRYTGLSEKSQLPPALPKYALPSDYGVVEDLDDYPKLPSGDLGLVYCNLAGLWRRGDHTSNSYCAIPDSGSGDQSTNLIPDDCWGTFRSSAYDIDYHADWNEWGDKAHGWWTRVFFDLGKTGIQLSLKANDWAYNFSVKDYSGVAVVIGDDYQSGLLSFSHGGRILLADIVWLLLFSWVGFKVLQGKAGMAVGELVMSLVMLGLSTVLMLNRADYMGGAFDVMEKTSNAILLAGYGEDPNADKAVLSDVIKSVQHDIHEVFVEQPYDYLNWGHPLGDAADPNNERQKCAAVRDAILQWGDHNDSPTARERMGEANCTTERDFNQKPTTDRLLGSLFSMVASWTVAFTLLALSLTVVVGKFAVLLLWAVAPFAALAAPAPAGFRRAAWLWATSLFQGITAVIGSSLLLSLLLLGTGRLLGSTGTPGGQAGGTPGGLAEGTTLAERFFVVILVVMAVAFARRRMLASGQATAGRLTDNLTNMRIGGGGPAWVGPTGSHGMNLLNIDRGLKTGGQIAGYGAFFTAAGVANYMSHRMAAGRGARLTGRMRAKEDMRASVQGKTYLRDISAPPPGSSAGPGPRGGYPSGTGAPGGGQTFNEVVVTQHRPSWFADFRITNPLTIFPRRRIAAELNNYWAMKRGRRFLEELR